METNSLKYSRVKPKVVTEAVLEKFPHEYRFNVFFEEIKKLKADSDTVNNIAREYVSTAQLFPLYKKTFGDVALGETTVIYRLRQISEKDYPDDFIRMRNTTSKWEPKYFVNRLNKKVLKKIYLPKEDHEVAELAKLIKEYEKDFRSLHELDDSDDDG